MENFILFAVAIVETLYLTIEWTISQNNQAHSEDFTAFLT